MPFGRVIGNFPKNLTSIPSSVLSPTISIPKFKFFFNDWKHFFDEINVVRFFVNGVDNLTEYRRLGSVVVDASYKLGINTKSIKISAYRRLEQIQNVPRKLIPQTILKSGTYHHRCQVLCHAFCCFIHAGNHKPLDDPQCIPVVKL